MLCCHSKPVSVCSIGLRQDPRHITIWLERALAATPRAGPNRPAPHPQSSPAPASPAKTRPTPHPAARASRNTHTNRHKHRARARELGKTTRGRAPGQLLLEGRAVAIVEVLPLRILRIAAHVTEGRNASARCPTNLSSSRSPSPALLTRNPPAHNHIPYTLACRRTAAPTPPRRQPRPPPAAAATAAAAAAATAASPPRGGG